MRYTIDSTLLSAVAASRRILRPLSRELDFSSRTQLAAGLAYYLWLQANFMPEDGHTTAGLFRLIADQRGLESLVDDRLTYAEKDGMDTSLEWYGLRLVDKLKALPVETKNALHDLVFVYRSGRNFMHFKRRLAKLRVDPPLPSALKAKPPAAKT